VTESRPLVVATSAATVIPIRALAVANRLGHAQHLRVVFTVLALVAAAHESSVAAAAAATAAALGTVVFAPCAKSAAFSRRP
jgi:hypothetical protein